MSKYVKNLIADHLRDRWKGVDEALLVSVAGLDANNNYQLRKELRGKNINLVVVKNSMARRATEGTALAAGFEGLEGTTAVMWGGDIVSLAKEIIRLGKEKHYSALESRGGVMGGTRISATEVEQVSKWPSRIEQLSILVGQILGPGALLASQLGSAGGALASQIKQHGEREEGSAEGEAAPAPAAT